MKLRLATLNGLLLLTLSVITAPVWALSFNQIFVFGDSFSDTGNNAVLFDKFFGGARTGVPIPSQGFIPDAPYASNRYSNGPVWAEQFAAKFGLSATASLLGGTDYAYGGARTGPSGTVLPTPPSLQDQVTGFLSDFRGTAPRNALYVLAGGGNDARDAASGGDPAQIISDYVNNISWLITTLASAGAANIVVWDVPDIGLAPAIRVQGTGASNSATQLVGQMNAGLDGVLQRLQAAVPHLIEFDVFGLTQNMVNHPTKFDLSNVTIPCATMQQCINNPDGYLFWDGVHLTTAGYGVVADAMLRAVPEPAALVLVVLGLAGLVGVRRTVNNPRQHLG